MAPAQKLLIDVFMAAAAVAGGELDRDQESMMVLLLLPGGRLMAFQTVHALAGMSAHFVFVDDGILRTSVAFRAFPGGAHQLPHSAVPSPPWGGSDLAGKPRE